MLNELLTIEKSAAAAGINMVQRHPDVKDGRDMPGFLVRLDDQGNISEVRIVPETVKPWTIRDGQHNSFPFMQPKSPLLKMTDAERHIAEFSERKHPDRRTALLRAIDTSAANVNEFKDWPGAGLLKRVKERRIQLSSLVGTSGEVVSATMDRFLLACESRSGEILLRQIVEKIASNVRSAAQDRWTETAIATLVGKNNPKTNQFECAGALIFDAHGYSEPILSAKTVAAVSTALRSVVSSDPEESSTGVCALRGGEPVILVSGSFPQPNVGALGQTYIFAKNQDIPSNDRYGTFASDALSVGRDTAIQLAAAFEALTAKELRDKTWRILPGEAPKQSDLLISFARSAHDVPVVAILIADGEDDEDFSEEEPQADRDPATSSIDKFIDRSQKVIEAVQAKDRANFSPEVDCFVFRRIDPANRKVVYAGTTTIPRLKDAVARWVEGERNVPEWLRLPLPGKKGEKARQSAFLHVAPLGLIAFSKLLFAHGGAERRQEISGIPAAEAFALFLEPQSGNRSNRRARRILHLTLARRSGLNSAVVHALRKSFDHAKNFDRREALHGVTVLGMLLHKLGCKKEQYMKSTAFQLGQLLAAVDQVHVGYCADVRGDDVPPTLLGNQIFGIAQRSASKALGVLRQRWKPYAAWATRSAHKRKRANDLVNSKVPSEQQIGWAIRKAVRLARDIQPVASSLAESLNQSPLDDLDLFNAQLLLGYMAGIPARETDDGNDDSESA
jgi:hypothetical protein